MIKKTSKIYLTTALWLLVGASTNIGASYTFRSNGKDACYKVMVTVFQGSIFGTHFVEVTPATFGKDIKKTIYNQLTTKESCFSVKKDPDYLKWPLYTGITEIENSLSLAYYNLNMEEMVHGNIPLKLLISGQICICDLKQKNHKIDDDNLCFPISVGDVIKKLYKILEKTEPSTVKKYPESLCTLYKDFDPLDRKEYINNSREGRLTIVYQSKESD